MGSRRIVDLLESQEVRPVRPMSFAGEDRGTSGQVAIGTIPTQIFNPRRRCSIKITQLGTVDVYVGFNSTVSTLSGDLLIGIKGAWLIVDSNTPLWAVAGSTGARVSYLELDHV